MKYKKIILISTIVFIFWITTSFILHSNFHTIFEIGIAEQSLWNTIQGEFFYSVSAADNYFSNHNSAILIFMLPFYYLASSIFTLFILLNISILLGVIPIYKLAKEKINHKSGIIFAISYLLFPAFYYSNLRSFHPIMIIIPFIAWSIYFFETNQDKKGLLFLFIAMLANETFSLTVIMFGIYLLLVKRKRIGLTTIFLGIIWFLFSTKFVIPFFSYGNNYAFIEVIYGHLGSTPAEIIGTIITNPLYAISYGNLNLKIIYLKVFFEHNLFLSLLNPGMLLLTIPIFLQNIFSSSAYKYNYVAHYSYPLIPILFAASIIGVKRILNSKLKILNKLDKKKRMSYILFIMLFFSIFNFGIHGLQPLLKDNCYLFESIGFECKPTTDIIGNSPKENYPIIKNFIQEIPKIASVSAQNHIFNHVSKRRETYLFERVHTLDSDYIILDKNLGFHDSIISEDKEIIRYETLMEEKDILLLKKLK